MKGGDELKANEEKINESLSKIESWVAEGQTDKEIAEKIGISYSTFRRYKKEKSELKAAIAQGKDKKNDNVIQALYKNCIGYKYYEETPVKVKEEVIAEDGKTVLVKERVEVKSIKKYKAPDLAAQKYWLNNRDKTKWQDDPNKVANDKKLTKLKEKEVNSKVIE
ncbi:MAG: Xaa-His dipeptidase [Clostridium sp.]|nr:Xaa-His dipeptidase [Clostridium sp.]